MTRFVVLAAFGLSLFAALLGKSMGMDAVGVTCLGFLSALVVLMLGGWVESVRFRARAPASTPRQ
jgi:hypothetical protein